MYRQDYIVRMFSEMAKAISAVLKLKREEKYFEAEQVVNDTLKEFSESDIDFLLSHEPGKLVIELAEKRQLTPEKLQLVAELLFQYGLLRKEQFINEDYNIYFERSLALFKFILRNQTQTYSIEVLQRINQLEELILE
jgi:hypothetical protein